MTMKIPDRNNLLCNVNILKNAITKNKNNNNQKLSQIENPHYDATVPRNDPRFLKSVRKWERRIGFVTAIRWLKVCALSLLHLVAAMFFVRYFFLSSFLWKTIFSECIWGQISGFGVTAGAHRYWTHRSYKAKLPLQIILAFCYSVAGQNTIYDWVRDHRVHHKKSDTSADPHDANRGLFFSHVGWMMMKKHPHVIKEGMKIDMTDITNDPLVQFHTRYFTVFKIAFCFVLPIFMSVFCWGETWLNSISSAIIRYTLSLNFTWSVNSFAHFWGNKPYDQNIVPTENWSVSIMAMGEGWHNYHHTFPWDYKAAELSYHINTTTIILDMLAKIGWVYDTKVASKYLIKSVINNRGNLAKVTHL